MKIGEVNAKPAQGVTQWIEKLRSVSDSELLSTLSSLRVWEWTRLEDLTSVAWLLDKLDDLFPQAIESSDLDTLHVILDKTLLILKNTNSKALYSSVDHLINVLDMPYWDILYKALQILHLLVNRITPTIKTTKAHRNPSLSQKLYIIGMGSNLNTSISIKLQQYVSEEILEPLAFEYFLADQKHSSEENVPAELQYTLLNRKRTNAAVNNLHERQLILSCQLLAISIFLQSSPEPNLLQDFCRSIPEIWLLPALPELLTMRARPIVHIEVVNLLSAILVIMEVQVMRGYDASKEQLINAVDVMLASWQQHGLMQSLLRDVSSNTCAYVQVETARDSEFVKSLLHLASIIADYKYRADGAHVPGMTSSLLQMLKFPEGNLYKYDINTLASAVRILSVLISHSIEMFKELEGLDVVLQFTINELNLLSDPVPTYYSAGIEGEPTEGARVSLIRALLRVIKISLNKWEAVPGISNALIRKLVESGLMEAFKSVFERQKFDIYEHCIQLLNVLLGDMPPIVVDLISRGTLLALLTSLESELPNSPKLMVSIARILRSISLHDEGAKVLEGFNTVGRVLQALGNNDGAVLSNDVAAGVAESFQELIPRVPNMKQKAVESCVHLITSLQTSDLSKREAFFNQLTNIGKLLAMLFNSLGDLIRQFFEQGGLEAFLALFKLPIIPISYSNDFHMVLMCFKSLPSSSSHHVQKMVVKELLLQLSRLESIIGPLAQTQNLSNVAPEQHEEMMFALTSADSFIEMTRMLVQYSAGTAANIDIMVELLSKLGDFMRILIAEQARLSTFSKNNDKIADKFNMPIDIKDIENPELKSFEENFYFTCQLSVRKLFRLATRIPGLKNRQGLTEEAGINLSTAMGRILSNLSRQLNLVNPDQAQAYYFSLLLSDIVKVLLHEQASCAAVAAYYKEGGVNDIFNFIDQLKRISYSVCAMKEMPYDLVNSLQILWNLCGKLLEGMCQGRFVNAAGHLSVLRHFGVEDSKSLLKTLQGIVFQKMQELKLIECGAISTAFSRSIIDVMKILGEQVKEPPSVDNNSVTALVEMGFKEGVARQALMQVGASSLEMAMEWIFQHPDMMDIQPGEDEWSHKLGSIFSSMYVTLINAIPTMPQLQTQLTDMVLRMTQKSEIPVADVCFLLVNLAAKLIQKLLGVQGFDEQPASSEVVVPEVCTFEQLGAVLHVLSVCCSKSADVLDVIKEYRIEKNFREIIKKLIENPGVCGGKYDWLGSLFALMDCLIRFGEESGDEIVEVLIELLNANKAMEEKFILDETNLPSFLALLLTITYKPDTARTFINQGGLIALLTARASKPEVRFRNLLNSVLELLKQLAEDPHILQCNFEIQLRQTLTHSQNLETFLAHFKAQASRSRDIFKLAFCNVCKVVQREELMVDENKERQEVNGERWDVMGIMAQALSEAFEAEQCGGKEFILQSESLVSLLAEIAQTYPVLVSRLLKLQLNTYDVMSAHKHNRRFLTHLIRNFIPFRYTLTLNDNKIVFNMPNTNQSVSPQNYQTWVQRTIKLLRALCFKQTSRNLNNASGQIYLNQILANNTPIIKVRKRIFREIRDMLVEQTKKPWFGNEKSMSIVRAGAIMLMQLLRETPKAPYARNNPAEIAKLLVSEQSNMVKVLCDISKGVKLTFKKASSMLNLLLAPLELLTRYNITFTLHMAKHQSNDSSEMPEEESAEEDMDKYEMYVEPMSDEDEDHGSEEMSVSGSEEMSVSYSQESDNEEHMDEEEGMEEEDEDEDEDIMDDEESDDLGEDEEPVEDIVIESRANDTFWAEDLEEEAVDIGRNHWPGGNPRHIEAVGQERHLMEEAGMGGEIEAPFSLREIGTNLYEVDDPAHMLQIIREFDPHRDEIINILMHRRGQAGRQQVPEPNPPRPPVEPEYLIDQLAMEFANMAQYEEPSPIQDVSMEIPDEREVVAPEQPVLQPMERPLIQPASPVELDMEMDQEEEVQPPQDVEMAVPEGIDPAFLEALPEDIRAEILAQHRPPPPPNRIPQPGEDISEDFLAALPPEIRAEVLEQRAPPSRAPQEMDNATFIASLTPELRREVLLTASEELLSTLPPEIVAEARVLQERAIHHNHQIMIERQQPAVARREDEGKEIAEIVADEKLANTLIQVEDNFLEVLLKALYLVSPVNIDILASLLLNLSAQPVNRHKLLDALVALAMRLPPRNDFPPQQLYGAENFLETYSQVYAIVAGRILDLLQHLTHMNPKASGDLINPPRQKLSIIRSLKGSEEVKGFYSLIKLLDCSLYKTSGGHVTPLINLINDVVNKQGENIPELEAWAIRQICVTLSYRSLNEATFKTVSEMVTKLAQNPINKNLLVENLNNEIQELANELAAKLSRMETSPRGFRELLLLRLCKIVISVGERTPMLSFLWPPLTEALNLITQTDSDWKSTTSPMLSKLLPVIETFFIAHSDVQLDESFQNFCDRNRKVLSLLVRQNPALLNDTFNSLITKFPYLLDFDNKRNYFKAEIRKLRADRTYDSIRLHVRRREVFTDSFHQLKVRTPNEMYGKLRVQFVGEEGLDAGGLTREWYGLLAREMFNPNYALFIPSANGATFQPNPLSFVNAEHLQFFQFIGRIIGKALCDGFSLDVYFTRAFYKHILGQEVTYQDMEDLDPEYYKSLCQLKEINLDKSDLHEYYFVYEEEEFGKIVIKELEPGGSNKRVTEDNKNEFIRKICEMRLTNNIREQINAFLVGFYEMVPKDLIKIFDAKELELLISGLPEVDVQDLKNNTEYHNYTKDTPVIQWFWQIIEQFNQEERAEFLQFVTGSSKVPLEGFKALPGMGGVQKFQIHKSFTGPDRLPTAHTCMNQLDLPEYPTKEILYTRLKLAVSEGKEGFGFM